MEAPSPSPAFLFLPSLSLESLESLVSLTSASQWKISAASSPGAWPSGGSSSPSCVAR